MQSLAGTRYKYRKQCIPTMGTFGSRWNKINDSKKCSDISVGYAAPHFIFPDHMR